MAQHDHQPISAREMIRAHAYPVLALVGSLSLIAIAVLQIPTAVRNHRFNRCVDLQQDLRRQSAAMESHEGVGKLNYLLAVQHCLGR